MRTSSRTLPPPRLGTTLLTANALDRLHPADVLAGLHRHAQRGFSNHANGPDQAPPPCCRLLSAHRDRHGVEFWIITEANGRRTTVLLPEDYWPTRRRTPLRWPHPERFVKENER